MFKIQNSKHVFKTSVLMIWSLFRVSSLGFRVFPKGGQAAMTAAVLLMVLTLFGVIGFVSLALRETKVARLNRDAKVSYFLSEAGQEDALYRIKTGKNISAAELISVGGNSANTTITTVGTSKEISSTGDVGSHIRRIKTTVEEGTTGVSFNYGVHVGEGGLSMGNGARINGSIFSNGDISGSNGAVVTGDAFVAAGTQPSVNQSWEVQNSEVLFGTPQGAVITTVDSAGEVGDYNSIALGPDNLARISYIDSTNDDLKFLQCANDNCSSAVLTVVDSAGSVDEVTSLAMGPDGFGRISYYHDGNDDLKHTQCSNADCSSRVTTNVDTASNVGDYSAIAIGPDGFPRIAYWYDSSSDVRFARCTNDSCSARVITNVETSGNVGEYIDLAMGADGFGRMSYYDSTNEDLKFTRCTDADCTSRVITTVDSGGAVGQYTSLALGSDGFARISYYDSSNGDLKFTRCTDADCTSRVITTVDSGGTVGQYTSLALGSDGFARISYYDSSNGDLKFARCTDIDCIARALNTVDNASSVGKPSSLVLGPDGFGRISSYASGSSLKDLRYVRCVDDVCTPPTASVDIAQSFTPSITGRVTSVDLFLRKIGNPANATVSIVSSSGGSPSTNPSNVLAIGTLNASSVGSSHAWHSVYLTTTPTLKSNTLYWIVIDAIQDTGNYYFWGTDSGAGYSAGSAKRALDWASGGWISISEDLDFRVYMGGADRQITNVSVNGNARAHIMSQVTVGGNAYGYTYSNGTVTGNLHANSISDCTVNGNASYNAKSNCSIGGSQTTPTTPPADLEPLPLPITQAVIDGWKTDAAAGGTCVSPKCDGSGNYKLDNGASGNLGPIKISGKLELDNLSTLTVDGTIWVVGDIVLSNNCNIRLNAGYGTNSGVIITDSKIIISNKCVFSGSGNSKSYIVALSDKNSTAEEIITVDNNSAGVIYYANRGRIKFSNNATAKEATAYGITMDNNAVITYESGLANLNFSSGPTGGYDLKSWKEVE